MRKFWIILVTLIGCTTSDKDVWVAEIVNVSTELCREGVPAAEQEKCIEISRQMAECVLEMEVTNECAFNPASPIPADIQLNHCLADMGVLYRAVTYCETKLIEEW